MKISLIPTIAMCGNIVKLEKEVAEIEAAGVDYFHIDVIDGHFAPNLVVGPNYVKALRSLTKIPMDLHLMVDEPERFVDMFDMQPGEMLSFHYETSRHPFRFIEELRQKGLRSGITLSPSVTIDQIDELLEHLDFVNVLTINPGFPGSKIIPAMVKRIGRLRQISDQRGLDLRICVDGSVGYENTPIFLEKGADMLILGYFCCFGPEGISESLRKLKSVISGCGHHTI